MFKIELIKTEYWQFSRLKYDDDEFHFHLSLPLEAKACDGMPWTLGDITLMSALGLQNASQFQQVADNIISWAKENGVKLEMVKQLSRTEYREKLVREGATLIDYPDGSFKVIPASKKT